MYAHKYFNKYENLKPIIKQTQLIEKSHFFHPKFTQILFISHILHLHDFDVYLLDISWHSFALLKPSLERGKVLTE